MLILNAITLFTPIRTNIYDTVSVNNYQQEYYNLLRRWSYIICIEKPFGES